MSALLVYCSIGGFVADDSEHICDETKRVESPPPLDKYELVAEFVDEVTEFTTRTFVVFVSTIL